ncbi:hypothetical protein NP233_g2308 [Leucocoprinus birnbaumii]|uniref:Uncharacterized protein n=1 Tax=Leucocoprinus birnbaumii TaxID=56174 RepID=A0AAD5VZ76_9AGAR|nr:hypothetical protein NP233_g2308 [Leucocoprinus birnbaumii]
MPSKSAHISSGSSAYQRSGRVDANVSTACGDATHTASATATSGCNFSINQPVFVSYQDSWVSGIILTGLHAIDTSGHLGYNVRVFFQKGRSMELAIRQEHVRAVPVTPGQYT